MLHAVRRGLQRLHALLVDALARCGPVGIKWGQYALSHLDLSHLALSHLALSHLGPLPLRPAPIRFLPLMPSPT